MQAMRIASAKSAKKTESPRTLTDLAYGKLREDIIHGEFEPGSKLRIEHLKARYEMGATPLREALSRLTENGFVIAEGQRGFKVSDMSLSDLEDITNVRVVVENLALASSFSNGDDEWEARVIAAFHQLYKVESADDPDLALWEERNRNFHLTLISACTSKWLIRFYETLYDQHKRYRNQAKLIRTVSDEATAEHRNICDAAQDRDSEKACQENERHIRRSARNVGRMILENGINDPE